MRTYDTIVIGAGLTGLVTACQLAQAKQKVLLVSTGAGAILLASGCIDLLGFQPVDSKEPVSNPLDKLDDFLADNPEHPYQHTGKENIKEGLSAFKKLVNNAGLDYQGEPDKNWLLPSTAGAVHPTCLAPAALITGSLSKRDSMLVVGFKELRDFYPSLISQNINEQDFGIKSKPFIIDGIKIPIAAKMNATPMELARAFERADFRRQVVKAVKSQSKGYDRVGFPAVLGIANHAEVVADLEKQLGKPVFEITALPPSVPGRRLFDALQQCLIAANGKIIIGSKVVEGSIEKGQVAQIRVETSNRLRPIKADNYVLATGGIFGGGIQTDDEGQVWESIFDLPVVAESNRHQWFSKRFLSSEGQPVSRYGVKVNDQLQPVNGKSGPVAKNLYVAGSTIAGYDWTSGRTGDGVALASAATIVKQIS